MPTILTTPEIDQLLAAGAPCALGVSGGKDSAALALSVSEYLKSIDYKGEVVLVHSDLGRVEWRDSLPTCERLAEATGLELVIVKPARSMMDRWLYRWECNVKRYEDLNCVKLILPWSTASMRFCTAEEKEDPISRALVARFPGQRIISAVGVRREESPRRAKMEITKESKKMIRKSTQNTGLNWNPILDWKIEDVFALMRARGFQPHEAYQVYGSSRVSCVFCILGSQGDWQAAASCADNHDIYREMVALEIRSTFGFQDAHWLGDAAPELLTGVIRDRISIAKQRAKQREELEARIPTHLLYTKGWPTVMPTRVEAESLAEIRKGVGELVNLNVKFTDADSVLGHYAELMRQKAEKKK